MWAWLLKAVGPIIKKWLWRTSFPTIFYSHAFSEFVEFYNPKRFFFYNFILYNLNFLTIFYRLCNLKQTSIQKKKKKEKLNTKYLKKYELTICLLLRKEIIMVVLVSIMLESANLLPIHALSKEDQTWQWGGVGTGFTFSVPIPNSHIFTCYLIHIYRGWKIEPHPHPRRVRVSPHHPCPRIE